MKNLGLIGNCSIAGLVDDRGELVWLCLPRFDGVPVFHSLLGQGTGEPGGGGFAIELEGFKSSRQSYDRNTAVLRTVLSGESGEVEIVDFTPRFDNCGRMFRPQTVVRRIRALSGWPRVKVRLRPRFDWGATEPEITRGSNHVRYVGNGHTMRLTTDAPIDLVLDEHVFNLDRPLHFVLGPDESLSAHPAELTESFLRDTVQYWRDWVRRLAVPFEWQDAVIRAAITLKLCSYEPTGAIVAAVTTSLPEAPDSGRNWDYRFCWVRDAYFTVRALNSLAATRTLEHYFQWLMNAVADAGGGHIQPVLGIGLERQLSESIAPGLQGYRGMGPVRIGNQAHEHFQHDTYGAIIVGAAPAFFDCRLHMHAGADAFRMLEDLGEQAWKLHDQPDAGIWELRTRARVHTSSSVMCWAACDRLAKIAGHLGLASRQAFWRKRADAIRDKILEQAWSDKRQAFVESFGGETLDASVLLMGEVGMLPPSEPRFAATVDRLSSALGRGAFMLRYEEADDFGEPEVGFNVCAFWRLDALARIGRTGEAREYFCDLLDARGHLGMMSEDTDFRTGEAWGNFPQTYSMVGIINGAMRLSRPWETEL
ncbi:glycoside hydrolase family 15 protein [Cribrihabitans pelagius]|uniref:glycoside hydrolase family 15 protein n=1 Tax=Cribrihabitans pelagius TaxID=1765746 RepID=UPI003B5B4A10